MSTDPLRRPPVVSLVWQQFLYQNKVFWRTPIGRSSPLCSHSCCSSSSPPSSATRRSKAWGSPRLNTSLPASPCSLLSRLLTNLAIGTAIARDNGILKRIRGTPIPPWGYIAGRVASSVYLAFLAMALMMAAGVVFYGVQIIARTLPAALLTFVVGVSCFAALGMLVAAISPNGDATPAITNATLLPVAFISNIFFPIENPPRWMEIAGNFFPLKAFAEAFRDAFDPTLTGSQFHWPQIGYLLLWGVVAGLLAIRFFRWEPSAGSTSRRRRRDESKPIAA